MPGGGACQRGSLSEYLGIVVNEEVKKVSMGASMPYSFQFRAFGATDKCYSKLPRKTDE